MHGLLALYVGMTPARSPMVGGILTLTYQLTISPLISQVTQTLGLYRVSFHSPPFICMEM